LLPGLPIGALAAFTPAVAAALLVHRDGRFPAAMRLLHRSMDAGRIRNKKWYVLLALFNPVVAVLSFHIMRGMGRAIPDPPICVALPLDSKLIIRARRLLGDRLTLWALRKLMGLP